MKTAIDTELAPFEAFKQVIHLLEAHHAWFSEVIPLIASENLTSVPVREALASDPGHRYAEGWPGERLYAGTRYIDQIELLALQLIRRLYDAEFVDVRPVSGATANIAAYTAFTEAGDTLMASSIPRGGHITIGPKHLGGTAGAVSRLNVEYLPFNEEEFAVDVDKTKKKVEQLNKEGKTVKLMVFGGSVFLRRIQAPVKELADFIHGQGGYIMYDAAHVLGLIIKGGPFQDPLREGADIVTGSTHKTFFSAQHGVILSWEKYSERVKKAVFPGIVSNHHLSAVAAVALTAAEYHQFGVEYANQVVRNSRRLAKVLYNQGIKVIGENWSPPFTETHTILVDVTEYGDGFEVERKLEEANIITNRNLMPRDIAAKRHADRPGAIRLGTSEVTRLGMKESDLEVVGDLVTRVIKGEEPAAVRPRVAEFRKNFQKVYYTFEPCPAHAYLKLRGT